ncbi:MAG: nicotinate-nucleotide pyrophosphorylase (carboxylating) [Ignavibacteria bacterium]|nr:MAG: nicotinate-nucleotide pyrophosphorylase (carboxylating) [Ignavibacteria bacterium]KAF0160882.1 MAG: nicotinate-nucleotide pyrophosphorylase (carboxylating) [Ignavibacteria bacterium]
MKLNEQTKMLITLALTEDIGKRDITTSLIVDSKLKGIATIVAKTNGIICGIETVKYICRTFDKRIKIEPFVNDGDVVTANQTIAELNGNYASILTIERTMLNFMQRMSGIATAANEFVKKLSGTKTVLLDTRKTAPGHRHLDKYAVKIGGGTNHRIGLFDMILIKENHITAAGSITEAVKKAMMQKQNKLLIEVETTNLEEVKEALLCGVDIIMLDNMSLSSMKKAVRLINGKCKVEASGGITLNNARKIAFTGVDFISVGAVTHSVKALDIAMYIILKT